MPPQPAVARRSARARTAILDATAELMAEVGYRKLSIEAIAARAGVGKQTIYRWWPSKGAVVFDAFMRLQEGEGATELPDTDDLAADIALLLRDTAHGLVDPRFDEPYRVLTTEIQHDPALNRELLDRLLGPLLEATRLRIVRGQEAGQIDAAVDPASRSSCSSARCSTAGCCEPRRSTMHTPTRSRTTLCVLSFRPPRTAIAFE